MDVEGMKKHVTHFSEQLRNETHHKQEVIVGGRVKSITPPVTDEYPTYFITLDDSVGIIHVYVPKSMMEHYINEIKVDNVVFVKGYVNVISRYIMQELKKDISIVAYDLKDIKQSEEYAQ